MDGTLSPIVDDPSAARPLEGTGAVLAGLAAHLAVVAVVSGRPAAYLLDRLPDATGVVFAGLYGLERVVDGRVVDSPEARQWRAAVVTTVERARREAPPGVVVEAKGPALALHARQAPRQQGWIEAFADEAAARTGLAVHPGRRSVELRPPGGGDKGTVVAEVGAGLEAVCFFGDDRGDLPAFAALRRLAAAGASTLAVAVDSAEAPPELLAGADVVVEGPEAVLAGLRSLLPGG